VAKNKKDNLDRVPPFLPIIWQDWISSPDIRSMSHTQWGIYLHILLHQWVYGNIPRGAWDISKAIGADYKVTRNFLRKYSHLLVCCQCEASWTEAECQCGRSDSPVADQQEDSTTPPTQQRRNSAASACVHNVKLDFIKKAVISRGTLSSKRALTEPNLTEVNQTKRKKNITITVPPPNAAAVMSSQASPDQEKSRPPEYAPESDGFDIEDDA
jgi:hypothetical protein